MSERQRVTLDLDDTLVNTHEAVRLFANAEAGLRLTAEDFAVPGDYWGYYESLWTAAGVDKANANQLMISFNAKLTEDQSDIEPVTDAVETVGLLHEYTDIDVITSRPLNQETATIKRVQELFGKRLGRIVMLGHPVTAKMTKGQAVRQLGASWHVDDNQAHCVSVIEHGNDAVLFGRHGWHHNASADLPRAETMQELCEFFLGRSGVLHAAKQR